MQVSNCGIALAFLAALAGCTSAIRDTGVGQALGGGGDRCGAAEFAPLVGQEFTVLDSSELPENRRVLFPGAAVGEDSDPSRLNIAIGTDDTITQVYCG
jgi:hypothetical protein